MQATAKPFETSPRPDHCVIGYKELGQALGRSAGGLKTMANTLPFRRWKCARAIIWDRNEVVAFVEAKQHKNLRAMCSSPDL